MVVVPQGLERNLKLPLKNVLEPMPSKPDDKKRSDEELGSSAPKSAAKGKGKEADDASKLSMVDPEQLGSRNAHHVDVC